MRVIIRAHASTRTTSLMRVKNSTCHFRFDTYSLKHWNEENERTKTSNLIVYQFSLTL